MCLLISISVFLLEYINTYTYSQKYLNQIDDYNYVHFTPMREFNKDTHKIESVKRNKLDGELFSSEIYLFNGIDNHNYKDIVLYVYNDEFFNLFYNNIAETDYLNDSIPVIAKANMGYNKGDVIKYLYKVGKETKLIDCYIYDIIDDYYFDYGSGGSKLSASSIFKDINFTNENFFIVNDKYMNINKKINNNEIIVFSNDISKEGYDNNIDYLKNIGLVNTKEDILNNTSDEIYNAIKTLIPYIVIVLIIALITIVSLALLNIYSNKKLFSVFFIIGLPKKSIIKLSVYYVLQILAIVSLFIFICIYVIFKVAELSFSYISLITIGAYYLIYSILTISIMLASINKISVSKIILYE